MNDRANAPVIIIKRKKVVAGGGHHGGAWKVAMFYDPICRTSTTLSGSDNHFGRSLSRCDVAYFK
jgi:hypothetical protein